MTRPKKTRVLHNLPPSTYYKPDGIKKNRLEEINVSLVEVEALRLVNTDNLSQREAAEIMDIHQSTFQRILKSTRKKITDALINGKAIKISGGKYKIEK